eukprot:CAMPEP_0203817216 /NCGR_PEP_ID=MMETSP0115-20131106/21369_1 /ASSEMBLY_ACC=CAM_ASM_000227 /TAXON_ID=33651 /ORGANISM="Bicosoecid sp, Strain ms1" /LENGTH=39 /DNA_ID= /DNA_START= /DNA_END= /DNA_ORIENTATION=
MPARGLGLALTALGLGAAGAALLVVWYKQRSEARAEARG